MNAKERLYNRLEGKPVDRVPNHSLVMMYAAKESGFVYSDVIRDAKKMADGMIRCYEKYGIDCLHGISDSVREPGDVGAEVVIPQGNAVPYCPVPFIKSAEDFRKLKMVEPCDGPAMSDRIELMRIFKQASKGEVPIMGWVEGAFAAACNFMDVQPFLMFMMEEDDAAIELIEYCYELETKFALAQIKEGADIIGVGDAAASLIGRSLYEKFAFEYEKRMFEEIHKAGAKVKLHICGNINSFMDLAAQTGTDMLDCDHMVDMKKACEYMKGRGCVVGNFDPASVMLQGTPEKIRAATLECVAMGENTIASTGCEVPVATPEENFLAMYDALKEWGPRG